MTTRRRERRAEARTAAAADAPEADVSEATDNSVLRPPSHARTRYVRTN